jgi:hypothetical protein
VTKVLVEVRRPPIPMSGDLLLNDVSVAGRHTMCLPPSWRMASLSRRRDHHEEFDEAKQMGLFQQPASSEDSTRAER